MDLTSTLPEEMLDDPNDQESMYNSSEYFKTLLSPKRVLFLFPKVWEIFEAIYRKQCEHNYNKQGLPTTFRCPCGRQRNSQQFSPILLLRLVCKSWCTSLDKFYQNRSIQKYMALAHDNISAAAANPVKNLDTICSTHFNASFLQHFSATHDESNTDRNPVIGRSLSVKLFLTSRDEAIRQQQVDKSNAVRKFGRHIWCCKIDVTIATASHNNRYYNALSEWMHFMPNLKVLHVRFLKTDGFFFEDFNQRQRTFQFPTLENLQFLSVATPDVPTEVINEITHNNRHVAKLEVKLPQGFGKIVTLPTEMPNLTQMAITCNSDVDMALLERRQVDWSLHKLYLDFGMDYYTGWSRIFALVENKWEHCLTHFMIRLNGSGLDSDRCAITEECASLRLRLPVLKHLTLAIGNYSSLDFFLPMQQTLQSLEVLVEFNEERWRRNCQLITVEKEQIIQFIGYSSRMLESNIWEMFPKLERFVLSHRFNPETGDRVWKRDVEANTWSYTRQQWQLKK